MSDNQIPIPALNGGDAHSQAEEWLAYLYSGEATDQGRERFSAWLRQSPQHAAAYARTERRWRQAPAVLGSEFWVLGSKDQEQRTQHPGSSANAEHHRWWRPVALAATLLLAVGIAFFQLYNPVTTTRYTSATGEIKTVQLADGSQITLSAASSLVAQFSKKQRQVELTSGGAYFEVAKDPQRIFSVQVAATQIQVVGTAFDVRKNANDIRISVTEGAVDIAQSTAGGSQRLTAGQQVLAAMGGQLGNVRPFDAESVLAWRDGRLVYVDARLADVLAEVNRYRQAKIVLAEDSLGDIRITTAFRTNQTDQLLSGLAATQPVVISRLPAGVLIKKAGGSK